LLATNLLKLLVLLPITSTSLLHKSRFVSLFGHHEYSQNGELPCQYLGPDYTIPQSQQLPYLTAVSRTGLKQPEVWPEAVQPVASGAAGFLQDVQPEEIVNQLVGRDPRNVGLPDGWAKFLLVR
jgi:hypothetical protein